MMKFKQQVSFNRALSLHKLIKILIDPILMIATLFVIAIYFEDRLTSRYVVLSIMLFALSFPGSWENSKVFVKEVSKTFCSWFLIFGILLFFWLCDRLLRAVFSSNNNALGCGYSAHSHSCSLVSKHLFI